MNVEGLARTRGLGLPARDYQFLSDLSVIAEEHSFPAIAYAYAVESCSAAARLGKPAVEAMARYRTASLAVDRGQPELAWPDFRRAEAIFATLPSSPSTDHFRADSELYLAQIEADRGEFAAAATRLARYPRAYKSLDQQLRFNLTQGRIAESRGEMHSALLAYRDAAEVGNRGMRGLTGKLRLTSARLVDEAIREQLRLYAQQDDAVRAWQAWRSLRTTLLGAAGTPAPQPAPEEAMVAVAAVRNGLVLLVHASSGQTVLWWPLADPAASLHDFASAVSDTAKPEPLLAQRQQMLSSRLVAPVERVAPAARRLLVSPDERFPLIAFAALLTSDGKPVADRWELEYSTGPLTRAYEPLRLQSSWPALVVAAERPADRRMRTLSHVATEARRVADAFSGGVVLDSEQANAPRVISGLNRVALFHFAGHARRERGTPVMLLASSADPADPRTTLNGSELAPHLGPQIKLAVLAACGTTSGETLGLLDSDGLVQPFLRRGAAYVVATAWNVDSEASAVLMGEFYRQLSNGVEVSRALHVAARKIRDQERWAHPYYWAGFVAVTNR